MRPIFVLMLILPTVLIAQTSSTRFTDRRYTRFKDGKMSTAICYDKAMRNGEALAYDHTGKIIYSKPLRYHHGSSTVTFTYYADGAVRRAEWHDNKDDGKWYSSVTLFGPDGNVANTRSESYNDTLRKRMVPKK